MCIYMLSGLGADRRVFESLDLSGREVRHVEWIDPKRNETIQQYALRLLDQIHHVRPILIAVSFGGIVAIEVGKLIPTEKIVLISSVRTKYDIPVFFRLVNHLWLHKILDKLYTSGSFNLLNWFFSAESAAEKELVRASFCKRNSRFYSWAIEQISTWKNSEAPKNAVAIHGTRDRIFRARSADETIPGGGHFMVLSKAKELSRILNKILTKQEITDNNINVEAQLS
jgi:pimeloyl-ACP methyl ester carboxylesterase